MRSSRDHDGVAGKVSAGTSRLPPLAASPPNPASIVGQDTLPGLPPGRPGLRGAQMPEHHAGAGGLATGPGRGPLAGLEERTLRSSLTSAGLARRRTAANERLDPLRRSGSRSGLPGGLGSRPGSPRSTADAGSTALGIPAAGGGVGGAAPPQLGRSAVWTPARPLPAAMLRGAGACASSSSTASAARPGATGSGRNSPAVPGRPLQGRGAGKLSAAVGYVGAAAATAAAAQEAQLPGGRRLEGHGPGDRGGGTADGVAAAEAAVEQGGPHAAAEPRAAAAGQQRGTATGSGAAPRAADAGASSGGAGGAGGRTEGSTSDAAARLQAVASLQRLFFNEMKRGGDPNAAAAAALLRLAEESRPVGDLLGGTRPQTRSRSLPIGPRPDAPRPGAARPGARGVAAAAATAGGPVLAAEDPGERLVVQPA